MSRPRAADDFDAIRAQVEQLRSQGAREEVIDTVETEADGDYLIANSAFVSGMPASVNDDPAEQRIAFCPLRPDAWALSAAIRDMPVPLGGGETAVSSLIAWADARLWGQT